jgi:hypothetical protein
VWDGQRRRWAFVLDPEHLTDLLARYGAGEMEGASPGDGGAASASVTDAASNR